MIVVIALSGALAALAAPSLTGVLARCRVRGAARCLASQVREARSRALAHGCSFGLVFEKPGAEWMYSLYADRDGDGVRTADIVSGTDTRVSGPWRLSAAWPHVEFGFLPLPRIRKLPPSSGWMTSTSDPIQFGSSGIVSFSPQGDASSGTFYLTDANGEMSAVSLFGPTARMRIYRYDAGREEWIPN